MDSETKNNGENSREIDHLASVQKHYRRRGYPRRWIDKRIGAISTRQDLANEWHRRGARQSEQFRNLTNELFIAAFGMDVAAYRQHKGIAPSNKRANLRDHLSDLEIALLSLAETAAIELSCRRGSGTFDQLLKDVRDAGGIVANARRELEKHALPPVRAA